MAPLNFPKLACWLRSRCRSQTRVIAETGETPALNQIELHPGLVQAPLRAFHAEHGIATEAWSPLGRGAALKDPEIAEIVARRSRDDGVLKPRKKTKGIAAAEIILRSKPGGAPPLQRLAVGHRAGGRARSVNAVGSRAQHRDLPPRDFFDAVQHKRRVAPAHSITGHRRADLSVSDDGDASPRIRVAEQIQPLQQKARRPLERPIVRRVIAHGDKPGGFGGAVGGVKQVVPAQKNLKVGSREGGVVFLGRLAQPALRENCADGRGKFIEQAKIPDNAFGVGNRRRIGDGRTRRQRGFFSLRNVRHTVSKLHREWRGFGKTSAFHRRKMLADSVDGVNRRAAGDQQAMQSLHILQYHRRIERQFDERRTSAGQQEEDQRPLAAVLQQIEDCAACAQALDRRDRMTGGEIPKSFQGPLRLCRGRYNAAHAKFRLEHTGRSRAGQPGSLRKE